MKKIDLQPLNRGYYPGYDSKYDPKIRPLKSIQGVILHQTGPGPERRLKEGKASDMLGAAVWIYTKINKFAPHYVVDADTGEFACTCFTTRVAQHTGSTRLRKHRNRWTGGWLDPVTGKVKDKFRWWNLYWEGRYTFPDELPIWSKGSVNDVTVGIEIVPSRGNNLAMPTRACWETIYTLVSELEEECGFVATPDTILTHSLVHPIGRTKPNGQPWDIHARWMHSPYYWDLVGERPGNDYDYLSSSAYILSVTDALEKGR